jgi:hypothetical protein
MRLSSATSREVISRFGRTSNFSSHDVPELTARRQNDQIWPCVFGCPAISELFCGPWRHRLSAAPILSR